LTDSEKHASVQTVMVKMWQWRATSQKILIS